MFIKRTRRDEIETLMDGVLEDDPDFRQRFISVLAKMTVDEWAILLKKILELVRETQETSTQKDVNDLAQRAAELTKEQGLSEKEPDTPVSSVKESGAV